MTIRILATRLLLSVSSLKAALAHRGPLRLPRLPEIVALGLVVAITALGAWHNLASNPAISYDEGYLLQVPRNLPRGFYGSHIGDRDVPFDTHLTTGPTVLVPVWLSFQLFGEGILQARGVTVVYSLLALAACYLLARRIEGAGSALLIVVLFSLSLYPYNRTVLGEVPGLFWLLLGLWLWIRGSGPTGSGTQLFGAGTALGMAALTKLALGPVAVIALALTWLGARLRSGPESITPHALCLPLTALSLPLFAWYAGQAAVLPREDLLEQIHALGEYQTQVLSASLLGIAANLQRIPELFPPVQAIWLVPALCLAVMRISSARADEIVARLLPVALLGGGLAYYLLGIGWPRYGFWFVATSAFLFGAVPACIAGASDSESRRRTLLGAIGWLAAAGVLASPLVATVDSLSGGDDSAAQLAGFLLEQVEGSERVGSTEREVSFLTGLPVHYPPSYMATATADRIARGFDWSWPGANWVVVGPIGEVLGADRRLERDPGFVERLSAGPYRVFQRAYGPRPGWLRSPEGATPTGPLSATEPIGQEFNSHHEVLTEIRVLLAGQGAQTNARVRLSLFGSRDRDSLLSTAEVSGRQIVQDRWYSFRLGRVSVIPGQRYYFELTLVPRPGRDSAPHAWYKLDDPVPYAGAWYRGAAVQEGSLYFGIVSHERDRRGRQRAAALRLEHAAPYD